MVTLRSQTAAEEEKFIREVYKELKQKGLPSYAFPRLMRISSRQIHFPLDLISCSDMFL